MVSPLVLAAGLQAGGSVLGGLASSRAANQAQEYNYAANLANIAAGERADLRGAIAAQLQRSRDEQGITDAAGNRVRFVPGVGWVTELSPDQSAIQAGSTAGQIYNLSEGERLRREGIERGGAAQRDENQVANQLLEAFRQRGRTDPNALADQIYSAGEIGRNQAMDRIGEDIALQMVRQGNTSNAADIMASRAREGARASEEARRQAVLQAPEIAQSRDASNATNLGNLYNAFRQRAVNPSGVPFAPVMPQGPTRPNTGAATSAIINASSRRPVQYDYQQPNFAGANAFMNIGQGVGNAIQGYYQQQQLDRYNKNLAETNRLLKNTGSFGGS